MFNIGSDKTIYLTRGDIAVLEISADLEDGYLYSFKEGDILRFQVTEKKKPNNVVLRKDVKVEEDTTTVKISLSRADTKIGELTHKPIDYWYEVEINPDTIPQTIIGYDDDGPKILRLYPEGDDNYETTGED